MTVLFQVLHSQPSGAAQTPMAEDSCLEDLTTHCIKGGFGSRGVGDKWLEMACRLEA